MRRLIGPCRRALVAALLLLAAHANAQSLLGTWVSDEPILVNFKFSITFNEDEYIVDCTLGQTIGTYSASKDTIYFVPTKVGINSGDVGKNDTWQYSFVDEASFDLSSGPIKVRLFRKPG